MLREAHLGGIYICIPFMSRKCENNVLYFLPSISAVSLFVLDAPRVEITHSLEVPQEGQYLKLECVSKGNPS